MTDSSAKASTWPPTTWPPTPRDIEDLRTTLGIPTWNLITNGSASRLAFEVTRRYPGGLRSLFIDSPSIPDPDFVTIGPTALDLSISRLVAACAAQPACANGFPHLDTIIGDAVARLDANPVTVDVAGTVAAVQAGHAIGVVVDGAALLRVIRADLGSAGGSDAAEVLGTVQRVLDGKRSADDQAVISLASDVGDCLGILTSCERPNFGALYSIVCRDATAEVDPSRLNAAVAGRPAYGDVFAPGPLLTPCAAWPISHAEPAPVGPITGGVPTMIIRGMFDPFSAPVTEVNKRSTGCPTRSCSRSRTSPTTPSGIPSARGRSATPGSMRRPPRRQT